jgi:hypothetical protein
MAIQEQGRRHDSRGDLFHGLGKGQALGDPGGRVVGVAREYRGFDRIAEGLLKKGLQSFGKLALQILPGCGCLEEVLPYPNRSRVEIRALQDRYAELQKGIQKQRGQAQLVGLVVESMGRTQVLGIGINPLQSTASIQRLTGHVNPVGHFGRVGL